MMQSSWVEFFACNSKNCLYPGYITPVVKELDDGWEPTHCDSCKNIMKEIDPSSWNSTYCCIDSKDKQCDLAWMPTDDKKTFCDDCKGRMYSLETLQENILKDYNEVKTQAENKPSKEERQLKALQQKADKFTTSHHKTKPKKGSKGWQQHTDADHVDALIKNNYRARIQQLMAVIQSQKEK